jgi:peptide/nickel transport system substrate-binding protein
MRIQNGLVGLVAAAVLGLSGCGNNESAASAASEASAPKSTPAAPQRGGEAIVLLSSDFAGSWPSGLDPATNVTGGANLSLMNAIFGGLFQLTADEDGSNARVTGVLASGFDLEEDGRVIVIHLREGVKFSDGTPFDAEAVRLNIERSLTSKCSCSPTTWPWPEKDRVTVRDALNVVLHFTRPYVPAINGFAASNLNWIASPTALRKLGPDQFKITPVGAGPFRVVSNQLSSKLTLERNPLYWQRERPYLDRLIFQSIGSEQAGYQALLAGDAHAFEGITSIPLLRQAEKNPQLTVTRQPATSPGVVQLNTSIAPFNNLRAREAIYYATDPVAMNKGLFNSWFPVSQSFTAPGGLFHHATVPGYRTYDLEKARAIVKELGTLRVTLGTLRTPAAEQIITALQTQWQNAGIEVKIESYDLGTLIQTFQGRKWQALYQTAGAYDPETGPGLRFRFSAGGTFSGLHDKQLDGLMANAAAAPDPQQRDTAYQQVAKYLSDHAYAPFLLAQGGAQITRGLYGPGLTTRIPPILINPGVLWQDVWMAPTH